MRNFTVYGQSHSHSFFFYMFFFLDYLKMGNSKTWHYSNSFSGPTKLFAVIFHTYFSKSPMHGGLHRQPFVITEKVRR